MQTPDRIPLILDVDTGRDDIEVSIGRRVPVLRPLEITPETHGPGGAATRRSRSRHARSRPVSPRS